MPIVGQVCKGHRLPYGTMTMGEEFKDIRHAWYTYGWRNDSDIPPLPTVLPEVEDDLDVVEEVSTRELANCFEELLTTLGPQERFVMRLRFGLGVSSDHTLEEIGTRINVTRERVRQIEGRALRKLRHPSRSDRIRCITEGTTMVALAEERRIRQQVEEEEASYRQEEWVEKARVEKERNDAFNARFYKWVVQYGHIKLDDDVTLHYAAKWMEMPANTLREILRTAGVYPEFYTPEATYNVGKFIRWYFVKYIDKEEQDGS